MEVLKLAGIVIRETGTAEIPYYRERAEMCGCKSCVDAFNITLRFSLQGMDADLYDMYSMSPRRPSVECIYREGVR